MFKKSITLKLNSISEEHFDEMLNVIKSYFKILKINKESKRIQVQSNDCQKTDMNYMIFIGIDLALLKQKKDVQKMQISCDRKTNKQRPCLSM